MGDILSLLLKRLGYGLITLLVISVIIFFMVELAARRHRPGRAGPGRDRPKTSAALREQMGLNDPAAAPLPVEWLAGAVHGRFRRL